MKIKTKADFQQTDTGLKLSKILNLIYDKFNIETMADTDERHCRNVFTLVTNIKGNLSAIWIQKDKNVKANEDQLADNLYKLYNILKTSDPWFQECKELIRSYYNWHKINGSLSRLKANHLNPKASEDAAKSYLSLYGKFLTFCDFSEDELIHLISQYPHLVRIYFGEYDTVRSCGVLML